jgi:hypothetical protein
MTSRKKEKSSLWIRMALRPSLHFLHYRIKDFGKESIVKAKTKKSPRFH